MQQGESWKFVQIMNSQKTAHTSPLRASYEVSFVRLLQKTYSEISSVPDISLAVGLVMLSSQQSVYPAGWLIHTPLRPDTPPLIQSLNPPQVHSVTPSGPYYSSLLVCVTLSHPDTGSILLLSPCGGCLLSLDKPMSMWAETWRTTALMLAASHVSLSTHNLHHTHPT